MKKWLITGSALLCMFVAFAVNRPGEIPFEKITIDLGAAEPAAFADVNHDGKLDILAGENWYEAPRWAKHHFRDIDFKNGYIDDFSDLVLDVNGDGYPDVVSCAWFAKRIWWNENPGKKGGARKDHSIQEGFNVEFAFLADIDNDGKAREILPELAGKGPNGEGGVAWYEAKNGEFVKHVVSTTNPGHGIGAGDVNGDGRNDILTPKGWYEAPADPRSGDWKFHQDFDLGQTGYIYVLDVNGDGRPDLVTTMAHDYGIFWMERMADGKWTKHLIDDTWSQSHAMTMVDLRGDGHKGFLTGKRFMAHDHDPGVKEPLGVYYYETMKVDDPKNGNVQWVKHVIDYSTRTGGGMQIPVADIDGDGHLDFAVGGKSGLYLFRSLPR
jgi:hypothetical protein